MRFRVLLNSFYAIALLSLCSAAGKAQTISTIAGNGTAGFSGDGGTATIAKLDTPGAVIVDTLGNIYIADLLNNRVRKVTAATGIISTIAGTGVAGYSGDGGLATAAKLNLPSALAFDRAGNLYVAEFNNNTIRKITMSTGIITTIAGTSTAGYFGDGGPATSAEMDAPNGLAIDINGNIYIADYFNSCVRKINAATGNISTIAGSGTALPGFTGDGGLAVSATFDLVSDICLDNNNNLYIADELNNRIRKVDAITGIVTTICGDGTSASMGDGGLATSAEIFFPYGVYIDLCHNLYICELSGNRVREIALPTGIINTFAGVGTAGFSGDGGLATAAEFQAPARLAINYVNGNALIADARNNRIRQVTGTVCMGCAAVTTDTLHVSGRRTFCGSGADTLSAPTASSGAMIAYNWQRSIDSISWSSVATTDTFATGTLTTTTYFRLIVKCVSTFDSTADTSAVVTINILSIAPATVSISAVPGFIICRSDIVTFTAAPYNGGATPHYQWKKNGVIVGTDSVNYTVGGLDSNDVISVRLTSSNPCSVAPVAYSSDTIIVLPNVTPSVSITLNPGDTICAEQTETFTAVPVNGGAFPHYQWKKNGTNVGADHYSYIDGSLHTADIISVTLTSDARCPLPATATASTSVTVLSAAPPTIYITPNPAFGGVRGDTITLTATVMGGGTAPTFQWYRNGQPIAGATSNPYVADTLHNNDTVWCVVNSNQRCAYPSQTVSNKRILQVSAGIGQQALMQDMGIYPNPNDGTFWLQGSVDVSEGNVQVYNVLGQLVYTDKLLINNGNVNQQVKLPAGCANGIYMLNLRTSAGNFVSRIEVNK